MQYEATAKYIRTSTRKMRLVADVIRGKNAAMAVNILMTLPKAAAKPFLIVLQSAIANAKKTIETAGTLDIKSIDVMGGPAMKRFHAVSRGMAHGYKKRMTHVRITLVDKEK